MNSSSALDANKDVRLRFKEYLIREKGYHPLVLIEDEFDYLLIKDPYTDERFGLVTFEFHAQTSTMIYSHIHRPNQPSLPAFYVTASSDELFEIYKFSDFPVYNPFAKPERVNQFPSYYKLIDLSRVPVELKVPGCDSDHADGEDLIGISKEVEAVAHLLSLRNVDNLAIGLFGNWGSGKSFFMKKVIDQIERQSKDNHFSEFFYQRMIQIEFNAWHYMDSNLLVSITNHIFEEIQNKFKENKESPINIIEQIYERLPSVIRKKSEREELEIKKNEIEEQLKSNIFSQMKDKLISIWMFKYLPKFELFIMIAGICLLFIWSELNPVLMDAVKTIVSLTGLSFVTRNLEPVKAFIIESKEKIMENQVKWTEKQTIASQIQEIDKELKTIKDGKILNFYFEDRIKDYNKKLGIIHVIRKDFEHLHALLETNELGRDRIERIVLYIDDLDRCTPKKVIEVIQAIHLLLSSKLFMVVVAVDIRWVSQCLLVEYAQLFSNSAASTYDYLEKIFQIPIRIQQITTEERSNYIKGLLKDEIDQESEEPNPPDPEPEEEKKDEDLENPPKKDHIHTDKMNLSVKQLRLTEREIIEMTRYNVILGNTPRTIKRFVNIFRLIVSKSSWDEEQTSQILFLLSLAVGFPQTSYRIFNDIVRSQNGISISEVIENQKLSFPQEIKELNKLKAFLQKTDTNFDVAGLKKLVPEVSRYSFYLNDLDE